MDLSQLGVETVWALNLVRVLCPCPSALKTPLLYDFHAGRPQVRMCKPIIDSRWTTSVSHTCVSAASLLPRGPCSFNWSQLASRRNLRRLH